MNQMPATARLRRAVRAVILADDDRVLLCRFSCPYPAVPTGATVAASEVDTLSGYLDYHRDTLRMKTDGLSAEQLSRVYPPATLTLGGLLKHPALNDDWAMRSDARGAAYGPACGLAPG
jgi:Protein of unknown function (DUF664)